MEEGRNEQSSQVGLGKSHLNWVTGNSHNHLAGTLT